MIKGMWARITVLSSDLKKERGNEGEREREQERGREGEAHHTPLSHQGLSFGPISLEWETSSVDYESTVNRKEVSSLP